MPEAIARIEIAAPDIPMRPPEGESCREPLNPCQKEKNGKNPHVVLLE
jgi:hypothetical protein